MKAALILVPQPEDEHVRSQLRRLRASGAELRFAGGKWRAFALAWGPDPRPNRARSTASLSILPGLGAPGKCRLR